MDNRQKVNAILRDEAFSKLSKIERRLVASYIEGVCDFTYTEIYKICMTLGLSDPLTVFIPKEKRK